jgi:hypothetical protein
MSRSARLLTVRSRSRKCLEPNALRRGLRLGQRNLAAPDRLLVSSQIPIHQLLKSGRQDLNLRPRGPEPYALAKLSVLPIQLRRLAKNGWRLRTRPLKTGWWTSTDLERS